MLALYRKRRPKAPPVQIFDDLREVCAPTAAGTREYKRRTEEMRIRQRELCPICTFYLSKEDATFEHEDLRGMGGARRDDRIWIPVDICDDEGNVIETIMTPQNFSLHYGCNREKGSQRLVISRHNEQNYLKETA